MEVEGGQCLKTWEKVVERILKRTKHGRRKEKAGADRRGRALSVESFSHTLAPPLKNYSSFLDIAFKPQEISTFLYA